MLGLEADGLGLEVDGLGLEVDGDLGGAKSPPLDHHYVHGHLAIAAERQPAMANWQWPGSFAARVMAQGCGLRLAIQRPARIAGPVQIIHRRRRSLPSPA